MIYLIQLNRTLFFFSFRVDEYMHVYAFYLQNNVSSFFLLVFIVKYVIIRFLFSFRGLCLSIDVLCLFANVDNMYFK
jgi:hypothetical protein